MQSRIFNSKTLPRQLLAMGMDVLCAWLALLLSISLREDRWIWPHTDQALTYFLAPALAIPLMVKFGLYRAIFRYTGFAAMVTTMKAIAAYGVLFFCYVVFVGNPTHVPRGVGILQPLMFLLLIGGNRAFIRGLFSYSGASEAREQGRMLIYGAGETGIQTAAAIHTARRYTLIGFVDDDPAKIGRSINGAEVWSPLDLPRVIRDSAVTDVLLAIPSMGRAQRNAIIRSMRDLSVHVRSVPGMADLTSGRAGVQQFRELDVDDLLGRDAVPPDPALIARNIRGQVVLVTGAGGSIGSELCRQIVQQGPRRLLLVEHSEFALYQIDKELQALAATQPQPPDVVALLGDVRDLRRMRQIIGSYRPATLYHAAAYKHVPMVEANMGEGICNNVFGTLNMVRAALEHQVAHFVLISTDKAVRPTNVMGASKRVAEMILQAITAASHTPFPHRQPIAQDSWRCPTRFSMVRFGNVLGSSGSVIPLFRRQIAAGGPVTVTHPEVTRYFMTIPEAAQLVLQAGAMAEGGDLFLLDMGEPIRIVDLARRMVTLSGLTVRDVQHPGADIAIEFTGLRPGEKLYEELLIGDNPLPTAHPRILRAREEYLPWEVMQSTLNALRRTALEDDAPSIKSLLRQLVSGYRPEIP